MNLGRRFFVFLILIIFHSITAYSEELLLNKCFYIEQQLSGTNETRIFDTNEQKFDHNRYEDFYVTIDLSDQDFTYAKLVDIRTDIAIEGLRTAGNNFNKTHVKFYTEAYYNKNNNKIFLSNKENPDDELVVSISTGIVEVKSKDNSYSKLQCEFTKPKIAYETIVCEGVVKINRLDKKTNMRTIDEEYFFDHFLFKIDYSDPALIYDQQSIISYIKRLDTTYSLSRPSYMFSAIDAQLNLGYEYDTSWSENQIIFIEENQGGIFGNTYMNLSLSTGKMVQEVILDYAPRTIDATVTTYCNNIDILQQYSVKNITEEKPIYADKDPNELVAVASGSGFFINDLGNIVTNEHVVEGCNNMKIVIDGEEIEAEVIATDNVNDLALLKTEFKNNDYFKLSKDDVERSQPVKAVGYGFGKNYSSDIKVTAGIVNSLSGYNDNYSEFQMDAAIQSGNSGGPVINEEGQVVGVSVAALDSIAVLEDTGTLPQNVNYAIKTSTLKQFLNSKGINYEVSSNGFLSFFGNSNDSINDLIDDASVYLSCYMTYAQIEESMTTKVMFKDIN